MKGREFRRSKSRDERGVSQLYYYPSDLFHQSGNVEPLTESDVIERARKTLVDYQASPLANYMPYTKHTDAILQGLADLKPRIIATMHGSTYTGDGERAIRDLAVVMREVLG